MQPIIRTICSEELVKNNRLKRRLFDRSFVNYQKIIAKIKPKMAEVRKLGDQAILSKYAERSIPVFDLKVQQAKIAKAYSLVDKDFLLALKTTQKNLQLVCKDQMKSLAQTTTTSLLNKQVKIWRRWLPIQKVGIYAPGGNANYPSSILMAAVPALVAGVKKLVLTIPPKTDGSLPPEVVVTANLLGIEKIYKVGGAQAIAALAYGTETIPKVDLVVGPGNQYVTATKIALFPQIQIDLPAGPSENVIIADDEANPRWVAADLITDCEHGVDSAGILLTTSQKLAKSVTQEIIRQLENLSTKETIKKSLKQYGAIIITNDIQEAIKLANEYAPEHLQILTKVAQKVASQCQNAGSVFIGSWSSKSMGDYCSGANHILPTGGSARQFGPVSVETFGRWQEFQQISQLGFRQLAPTAQKFAKVEDLPAHNNNVAVRLEKTPSKWYTTSNS